MPRTTETGGGPRAAASGRASRGRAAFRRGHGAEGLAACWLRLKGYRILARNWRSAAGEIDLIARRGATLVIVEVKQRGDLVQAADALPAGGGGVVGHRNLTELDEGQDRPTP